MPSAANLPLRPASLMNRGQRWPRIESGFVLPVALFALVAATILTLALVKMNMISLRIGGASVIAQEAQSSAEMLLSNFFTRNPLDPAVPDSKYIQGYTPCGVAVDDFDCSQISSANLPAHTVANAPIIQRIGCGAGPRSEKPTQAGTKFNYNHITTSVDNTFYGSRAEVAMGVAKLVIVCP